MALSSKQKELAKESVFLKSSKKKREQEIKEEFERLKAELEEVFTEAEIELEEKTSKEEKRIWVMIMEKKAARTMVKISTMLALEIPVHYIVVRLIH